MAYLRIGDALQLPFPVGWLPTVGEGVLVPSVTPGRRNGYQANVRKILNDVIRVRTWQFRGHQEFLLQSIRPIWYWGLREAERAALVDSGGDAAVWRPILARVRETVGDVSG